MTEIALPEAGALAPAVSLPGAGGETHTLAQHAGRPVVLYFYPKADTPGCTKQAVAFTAMAEAFAGAGAMVFGVSRDPVAKLEKFVAKHGLGVRLLSDAEGDVCERYGVWVEKSMYGKTYMGVERSTFLIDGAGVIRRVWRKVKVAGHAEAVLDAVRAL